MGDLIIMEIYFVLALLVFILLLIQSFFMPFDKLKNAVLTKLEYVKTAHDYIVSLFPNKKNK